VLESQKKFCCHAAEFYQQYVCESGAMLLTIIQRIQLLIDLLLERKLFSEYASTTVENVSTVYQTKYHRSELKSNETINLCNPLT
jgi:hypothetical protein